MSNTCSHLDFLTCFEALEVRERYSRSHLSGSGVRVIVLSYLQPRISSVRFRGFRFPTALERSVRPEERGSVSPAPAGLRIPGGRRTGGGMRRLSGEHTLSVGFTEAVGRCVCDCDVVGEAVSRVPGWSCSRRDGAR